MVVAVASTCGEERSESWCRGDLRLTSPPQGAGGCRSIPRPPRSLCWGGISYIWILYGYACVSCVCVLVSVSVSTCVSFLFVKVDSWASL